MTRRLKPKEREWHRKQAVELFNGVWTLIDKRRRTQEEVDWMIHAAHASRHHWGIAGTARHWAIGEWQVSRVYAVLRRPEPALFHARRCLELCEEHKIGDFPLAFAHEALARAHAAAGRRASYRREMKRARAAGKRIKEPEDRGEFFRQLRTVSRAVRRPRR